MRHGRPMNLTVCHKIVLPRVIWFKALRLWLFLAKRLAIYGPSAQPVALARDHTHHVVFTALPAAAGGRGRDFTCGSRRVTTSESKAERRKKGRAEERNSSLGPCE
jgi:hypothetical protein